jgi:hypothetical protein
VVEPKPSAAPAGPGAVHPSQLARRGPQGGFVIEVDGQEQMRVRSTAEGFSVEHTGGEPDWSLRFVDGGFVLADPAGRELARSSAVVGSRHQGSPRFLLLDDGRLFRLALGRPRDGSFELSSWEVPGAYLQVLPRPEGWELVPAPACAGLGDLRALTVLAAAELFDDEGILRVRE